MRLARLPWLSTHRRGQPRLLLRCTADRRRSPTRGQQELHRLGEEPLNLFKHRLNNLIILSVKSRNIKDFDNKMRKFMKGSKFATEAMNKKRNETFIAIDLSKIYKRSQVDKETSRQV